MADKIYQTEGAMEMAASIKPMSGGYYLATAEDIYIGDNKSLADYIAAGGGGGSGDSSGVKIPVLQTTLTLDSTLQDMLNVLQANGITGGGIVGGGDYCLVQGTGWFNDVIVRIYPFLGDIKIGYWFLINDGIDYSPFFMLAQDPSTTIGEVNDNARASLETTNKILPKAINELNQKITINAGSGMPTIRFVGLRGNNYLSNLDGEEQSVTFVIEVTAGSIGSSDTLQICGMRTFKASPKNKKTKRKLRRFAEYEITEDDARYDRKFLSLTVNPTKKTFAFLAHNNRQSGGPCDFYFRIRRPVGDLQGNDSGMTTDADFSNVVAVSMLNVIGEIQNHDDGSNSMSVKINIV